MGAVCREPDVQLDVPVDGRSCRLSKPDLHVSHKYKYRQDYFGRTGPTPWTENFSYDGFGNLTAKNLTGGSPPPSIVVDPRTNQGGGGFDANGNLANPAGCIFGYDVENRMVSVYNSVSGGPSIDVRL